MELPIDQLSTLVEEVSTSVRLTWIQRNKGTIRCVWMKRLVLVLGRLGYNETREQYNAYG